MEIKQLTTIQTILTKGSFLKAAESLGYAPSTISLHIQQLEAYLGIRLFEKRGRRMALTAEGQVFWENARHVLEQFDQLKDHTLSELSKTVQGHVRIGTIESAGKKLPPILIPLLKKHPHLTISIEYINTNTLCERVLHEELDIGIGPVLPNETRGLHKVPLFVEEVVVLLPEQHPLAATKSLTLANLGNENLILSEPLNAYRAALEQRIGELGVPIKPVIEIGDSAAIVQFVQGGAGIALLPASAVQPPPASAVLGKIQDIDLRLTMGLIRREKRMGNAIAALYRALYEELNPHA